MLKLSPLFHSLSRSSLFSPVFLFPVLRQTRHFSRGDETARRFFSRDVGAGERKESLYLVSCVSCMTFVCMSRFSHPSRLHIEVSHFLCHRFGHVFFLVSCCECFTQQTDKYAMSSREAGGGGGGAAPNPGGTDEEGRDGRFPHSGSDVGGNVSGSLSHSQGSSGRP